MSTATTFDPTNYQGPVSELSDDQLNAYIEAHEEGTTAFIAGMRELATRVSTGPKRDSINGFGTAESDVHSNGSVESEDKVDTDQLKRHAAQAERERDKHESHAAQLQEENLALRTKLKEHGKDPDRILEGPNGLEWGHPIPIESTEAPESLPLDAFPEWIRDHIESVSEFVQVPADVPALLALTILSGVLQKKTEIVVEEGRREAVTLWGASVIESGGRKSPAFKHMRGPVEEYEKTLRRRLKDKHQQAKDQREILKKRLHKAKKVAVKADGDEREKAERAVRKAREELENHHVPPIPQLWVDDITGESLLQELGRNYGRLLAMSPEGDLFKFMAGRYNSQGSVLNVYKKAYTGGEAVRDNRVTREGTEVSNPALAVCICPQPQVLRDLARKETFRGEGLLARFLYVVPPSNVGYRKTGREVPPLDGAAKARYEKRLTALLKKEPKDIRDGEFIPHELHLSEEARPVLWKFEKEVERMLRPGERLDGMKDWGNKLVGQALRIAGVLHVASTGSLTGRVSADVMSSGVRLARAFIPHAKVAYDLLNANEQTRLIRYVWRRMCEKLDVDPGSQYAHNSQRADDDSRSANTANTAKEGSISKRDLFEATKGKSEIASVSDLETPLRQLEEHNLIQVVHSENSGRGRPASPEIHINPLVVEETG